MSAQCLAPTQDKQFEVSVGICSMPPDTSNCLPRQLACCACLRNFLRRRKTNNSNCLRMSCRNDMRTATCCVCHTAMTCTCACVWIHEFVTHSHVWVRAAYVTLRCLVQTCAACCSAHVLVARHAQHVAVSWCNILRSMLLVRRAQHVAVCCKKTHALVSTNLHAWPDEFTSVICVT